MRAVEASVATISKGFGFLRRQQRDWKTTVIRSSLDRFTYQMVFPYQSVYTVALGANATQLGFVNSAGMGIAGLLSPLTGWLIDRIGTKRIYLIGIGLLTIYYFIYGVAQSWTIIIFGMAVYWLGFTTSMHSCGTICGNSLANKDRATGMSLCETVAAGLLGMAGPILGALLVTTFGGVNTGGIRPLYFIGFAVTIGTFLLILTRLSNRKWGNQGEANYSFFTSMSQVFKQGHNLKRWVAISCITFLPMGMILPFTHIFAHEIKGADQYILGAMVTGYALIPLVLGIPLGRLADKIGRKKVLYLMAPLFWASNLMLIWAPSPAFLIAAGALQGFFQMHLVITGAMTFELVPPEQMGRWLGMVRFFRMLVAASAAYLAGAIWDNIGPQYLFLVFIGLDTCVRIPLLIGMHETRWQVKMERGE